jgi:hypothetical protein
LFCIKQKKTLPGIGVILAGDFSTGRLPVNVPASRTLLDQNVIHGVRDAQMTNLGLSLFQYVILGANDNVVRFSSFDWQSS